jgi:hypothetical protein
LRSLEGFLTVLKSYIPKVCSLPRERVRKCEVQKCLNISCGKKWKRDEIKRKKLLGLEQVNKGSQKAATSIIIKGNRNCE